MLSRIQQVGEVGKLNIGMNKLNEYKDTDRPPRPPSVKRAISRAMKGKSNFDGESHSKVSKEKIALARGHDDRVDGRKWSHDRNTGKENRSHTLPDNHKWGRRKSFSRWLKGD